MGKIKTYDGEKARKIVDDLFDNPKWSNDVRKIDLMDNRKIVVNDKKEYKINKSVVEFVHHVDLNVK